MYTHKQINYIKELLYFEQCQFTDRKLSAMAQLLWYKLISLDNQSRWTTRVNISNQHLASLACISLNTLKRARQELIDNYYIIYTQATNNNCGVYDMIYSERADARAEILARFNSDDPMQEQTSPQ